MADITPRHYLYGVIIFMFFIVGGMGILSIFQTADADFDSSSRSGEFNRTFNKLSQVESGVGTIESSIKDADTDFGAFGVLNALISSAWQSLKLMFTSWSFMDAVFEGMTSFFGVPAWIPLIIGLFITVTLAFAIYSLIFQQPS